ncbi:response regulator receiver/ANTAR domain-containing protein [Gracilibacillus halophilus YIM-C55.5]|uniref:Response regulator receiver/ANTAR domain-containing protein n=1 Tax=Gracilibacillus halophilus YIM-C55.5 TaxID=1308866 RepID=N4WL30_9BACI|nr:response regulator [Gracilibacillus halophilus]ENH96882.1 response regulator receiver/ANTAR domain-containing protein [Gracilibacillus halophilus YIM-C55.5]
MNTRLKVLVAEDEMLILMGLKSNLEELGHEVIEATNGEDAIEKATKEQPDLLVMDISMPNIDGIEAIKIINQKLFIPSIIISAYHNEELIRRATEEGVLNYLVKPVDKRDLKVAIEVSLARYEEFKNIQYELDDTKKALEARKYIEKAKGILMENKELKEPDAMKKLQEMSRNRNKKLVEVAKDIIELESIL